MKIKASTKTYEVKIKTDFSLIEDLSLDDTSFVVIDKLLYGLYKDKLFSRIPESQLYLLDAIEENKTIETALDICEIMTSIPAKRNTRLISFGGVSCRMSRASWRTSCIEGSIGHFTLQPYLQHVIAV